MPELLEINTALIELEKELEKLQTQNSALEAARDTSIKVIRKYEENMQSSINLINKLVSSVEDEKGSLSKGSQEILSAANFASQSIQVLISGLQGQQEAFSTTLVNARQEIEGFDLKGQQIQIEKQIKALSDSSENFSNTVNQFLQEIESISQKHSDKVIADQKGYIETELKGIRQAVGEMETTLHERIISELGSVSGTLANQKEYVDKISADQKHLIESEGRMLQQSVEKIGTSLKTELGLVSDVLANQKEYVDKISADQKHLIESEGRMLQQSVEKIGTSLKTELGLVSDALANQKEQFDHQIEQLNEMRNSISDNLNAFGKNVEATLTSHNVALVDENKRLLQEKVVILQEHIAEQDKKLESHIHAEVVEVKYELGKSIQESQKVSSEGISELKNTLSQTETQLKEELKSQTKMQNILLGIIVLQLILMVAFRFM